MGQSYQPVFAGMRGLTKLIVQMFIRIFLSLKEALPGQLCLFDQITCLR